LSLSGVLNTARFALDSAAAQTALVSRNIAGAGDATYSRKLVESRSYSTEYGSPQIRRAENPALFARATEARSESASASVLENGMNQIRSLFGGDDQENAPSTLINRMQSALRTAASDPSDRVLAGRALDAASTLANSIRNSAAALSGQRNDIEARLGQEAGKLNTSLASFETLNSRIVAGTRLGQDTTDLRDQRDEVLRGISDVIGVKAFSRNDNDMVLQTDSGVLMFETRARPISFQSASPLQAGQTGGRFMVDGVAVAGPNAVMPTGSGTVFGLINLRDGAAMDAEAKLDEAARMLISAFREKDQTAGGKPDIAGLFSAEGLTSLPPDGVRVPGIAQRLLIAASVDPAKGGNINLLRDGGIGAPGDADYRSNTNNLSGFTARLNLLAQASDQPVAVDANSGLGTSRSVADFSARAFGALEEQRRNATDKAEFSSIVLQRSTENLASETGVSLDAEMARLLELERSYSASAKIISVVDAMFDTLFSAVR
jgi:flagellar hook-associated protein 1